MSSSTGKQYGLILSKKKEAQIVAKPSVFDSGSDSEEEVRSAKPIRKELPKTQPKLKAQLEIQKALDEDPSVYEYDSIYDDMKEKRETKLAEVTVDKKPKYIQNLLKAADRRKKEYERRVERKIQKEREEEGEKFADKEAFVTSAYKKKMQELQEEEEKEKRMDAIEAMMDVTKQKDLSGFYRHLLNRETSGGEKPQLIDKIKEEKHSSSEDEQEKNPESHKGSSSKNLTSTKDVTYEASNSEKKARDSLQQLRRRTSDSNISKPKTSTDNVDADSDFTSDSESSSSDYSDGGDVASQADKKNNSHYREKSGARKRMSPPPSPVSLKRKDIRPSPERQPRRKEKIREESEGSSSESGNESQACKKINSKSGAGKRMSPPASPVSLKRKEHRPSPERQPKRVEKSKEDTEGSSSESDSETNRENHKNNAEPVLSDQEKLKALFAKRTVGDAFTAAQERYWQRKRLKTSGLAATCA